MYAQGQAASAYAAVSNATAQPKSIEYRAFARANGLLAAAEAPGKDQMVRLAGAVDYNTRLWSVLAVDAAGDSNTLPEAARAGILSLALYAMRTGQAVLRQNAPPAALAEINTTIMRGLRPDEA